VLEGIAALDVASRVRPEQRQRIGTFDTIGIEESCAVWPEDDRSVALRVDEHAADTSLLAKA